MRKWLFFLLSALASITLGGCSGTSNTPDATVTKTVTSSDSPTAASPDAGDSERYDVEADKLDAAFELLSDEDQSTTCFAYENRPELTVQQFVDGVSEDLDKNDVKGMLDRKCMGVDWREPDGVAT